MPRAPTTSDLKGRLETIRREIEKLQAQESLLLDMLGEPVEAPPAKRAAKGSVKARVLNMLEDRGRSGLNAAKAVEISEAENDPLDRGSVSSLLSRLKQDGVVVYDGSNYRLKEFAGMPAATPTVTPIRTSGDRQF